MVEANSIRISFCYKYLLIVSAWFFTFFLSGVTIFADDLYPPTFLSAVSDRDGEVPLFWFSPHPETSEVAYHGDEMLGGTYVVLPWRESCVAVRMTSPSVPFYLLKSMVYISHQGAAIDTNYHFDTPFFVTVNQDSGGLPRNSYLDSVSASAGGEDSLSNGEWVDVEHNILMEDSVFWVVFHWLEGSPLSPLVGEDDLPGNGNSLWGKRTFFHLEWHQSYHNLMIRAQIATNSGYPSDVDSFRVYRSDDPDSVMYQSNVIATTPGELFQHTDSPVTDEQTCFYRVISLTSEWQSKASNLAQATPRREAVLAANKEAFLVYATPGQRILDDLALTNTGGLPLWFRVRIDIEEADRMGGSDPFGYTWTDNIFQMKSGFAWVDIENSGTQIGYSGDDNEDYGFFGLGFSFPFYGNTFDSLRIASDGWAGFSEVLPCYQDTFKCFINRSLPWLWGPYHLLAPFWEDLALVDSSAIYFYSNSDSAIISFLNIHRFGQGGPYTFQTILTPDGEITFQYLHTPDSSYSATVGIQNQDGTIGLEVLYDQKHLQDSLAIKIRPGWVKVDSMEGSIEAGQDRALNLTFDPLSYPRGVYRANLLIDSWDKNHQLETKVFPLTFCLDTTTSVEWTDAQKPEKISLLRNYPNPFNPLTTIRFTVGREGGKAADVSLKIYNLLGQKVRSLVDEQITSGTYHVMWDGKDDKGIEVASGIYFCKLKAGSHQKVRKMVLLR